MFLRKLIRSWLFEILLSLAVMFGVFYVFNAALVNEWVQHFLTNILPNLFDGIAYLQSILSDSAKLKKIVIVLAAIAFVFLVIWRLIWRLQSSKRFTSTTCPSCDEPLVRVKSKEWMRYIRKVLPLRRFYCRSCGWKGIRIKGSDHVPLNVVAGKPTRIHVDKIS